MPNRKMNHTLHGQPLSTFDMVVESPTIVADLIWYFLFFRGSKDIICLFIRSNFLFSLMIHTNNGTRKYKKKNNIYNFKVPKPIFQPIINHLSVLLLLFVWDFFSFWDVSFLMIIIITNVISGMPLWTKIFSNEEIPHSHKKLFEMTPKKNRNKSFEINFFRQRIHKQGTHQTKTNK